MIPFPPEPLKEWDNEVTYVTTSPPPFDNRIIITWMGADMVVKQLWGHVQQIEDIGGGLYLVVVRLRSPTPDDAPADVPPREDKWSLN